jgi:hypothetical protein
MELSQSKIRSGLLPHAVRPPHPSTPSIEEVEEVKSSDEETTLAKHLRKRAKGKATVEGTLEASPSVVIPNPLRKPRTASQVARHPVRATA